jgi:hypothetical protein
MATLNTGGYAEIESVSCASKGNCAAAGFYKSGEFQAFVVSETNGTWGDAEEVPGLATLGGDANTASVSCPSAGNCTAGGAYYSDGYQAFVVSETNGTWGEAEEVPGLATMDVGGRGETWSVSCASADNCVAGGQYGGSKGPEAFVVSETNGTWGDAEEVPGTATLNVGGVAGGYAETDSVSCTSVGNCSAGGYYTDSSGSTQAFVVSETSGIWGDAEEVPGTATLNARGWAHISSVSCASPGNCSAGGYYADSSNDYEAFVVSETSGIWGYAEEVPGTASIFAQVSSVSCTSPGNCAAGGIFSNNSGEQAFVVSETNGTWGDAGEVPGTATLNAGENAETDSVSCTSPGNCAAGGIYMDSSSYSEAFVVSETNGTWGDAEEVPGTATLNTGGLASVYSVSCASGGNCVAGGSYENGSGTQVFVVDSIAAQARVSRPLWNL